MALLKNNAIMDSFKNLKGALNRWYLGKEFKKLIGGDMPVQDPNVNNDVMINTGDSVNDKGLGTGKQDLPGSVDQQPYIPGINDIGAGGLLGKFETSEESQNLKEFGTPVNTPPVEPTAGTTENNVTDKTQTTGTQTGFGYIPGLSMEDIDPSKFNQKLKDKYNDFVATALKFGDDGQSFIQSAGQYVNMNQKKAKELPKFDKENVYRDTDGTAYQLTYKPGTGFIKEPLKGTDGKALNYNEVFPSFQLPFDKDRIQVTINDEGNAELYHLDTKEKEDTGMPIEQFDKLYGLKLREQQFDEQYKTALLDAKINKVNGVSRKGSGDGSNDGDGSQTTSGENDLIIVDQTTGKPISVERRIIPKQDANGRTYNDVQLVDKNTNLPINGILDEYKNLTAKSKFTRKSNQNALDIQGYKVYTKKDYLNTDGKDMLEEAKKRVLKLKFLKENNPEFYKDYLTKGKDENGKLLLNDELNSSLEFLESLR